MQYVSNIKQYNNIAIREPWRINITHKYTYIIYCSAVPLQWKKKGFTAAPVSCLLRAGPHRTHYTERGVFVTAAATGNAAIYARSTRVGERKNERLRQANNNENSG